MQQTCLKSCRATKESNRFAARPLERTEEALWAAYERSDRVAVFRTLLARLTATRNNSTS